MLDGNSADALLNGDASDELLDGESDCEVVNVVVMGEELLRQRNEFGESVNSVEGALGLLLGDITSH